MNPGRQVQKAGILPTRLWCVWERVLRRVIWTELGLWEAAGEHWVTKSVILALCRISLGWSDGEGWNGSWHVAHVGTTGMPTEFWSENLEETVSVDLGVDEAMILKWVLKNLFNPILFAVYIYNLHSANCVKTYRMACRRVLSSVPL
jgi:hypothetical protein